MTSSVANLVRRAAAWYGQAAAVVDTTRTFTFADVDLRSNRLANALLQLTSEEDARVAMLMPNRAEAVECDFGISKAGRVRVPINPRLVDEERRYILNDSQAEVLIVDSELAPSLLDARADLPYLRSVLVLGPQLPGADSYDDVLAKGAARPPSIVHSPDAPSFILYTSGTTGRPKGALTSNRGRLAATVNMWVDEVDVRPGDGMLHVGSMAHGSGSKVLAYFAKGARNLTARRFDPEEFVRVVASERVTGTFLVPTMITMLLEAASASDLESTSLKTVSYGGAPISPDRLAEALERFGNVFVQVYGSCEALHPVLVLDQAAHENYRDDRHRLASVGREVSLVEVRLVNEGTDAGPGEPGEIWVRGGNVMLGYWGNPEATEEVLTDGWYRSGDLAYRDEEGLHYIVGRNRETVITGGLNVYPAEVERVLCEHPAVLEAAVIGVPDEVWGESVTAFVVGRPEIDATEEDLIQHVRQGLASYKKPRRVIFVEELPKGPSGKILRRELQPVPEEEVA